MKKIKIIRIIDRLNIGGPAIHCVLLTAYLDPTQFESKLVMGMVGECEGDMSYLAEKNHIVPLVIPQLGREISFFRDIFTLIKLCILLYREKPDIVHTHKSKAGVLGRLAAILMRVPIIVHTFHGHVFHHYFGKWKTLFFLKIERFFARFTHRIIVISQQQLQEINEKYKVGKREQFSIIPLGFDFSGLEKNCQYSGWLKKAFGISETEIVIGLVGRLTPVKNHQMLLKIAQNMKKNYPQLRFVIIGDGECRQQLQEEASRLDLKNIVFTGWIQESAKIYSDLDIVVLTSHNEGTPVTLIEAMFCGKPIIATKVGGVIDLIENGTNGFLVQPGNISEFQNSLVALLDSEKRYQLGQSGKEIAQKFAISRLTQDIKNLYIKLFEEKKVK